MLLGGVGGHVVHGRIKAYVLYGKGRHMLLQFRKRDEETYGIMPFGTGKPKEEREVCVEGTVMAGQLGERDAFGDSLNLADYGVKEMASEGRPPYDPKCLFKLHIYGSDNRIKSSRKLAKSCKVNIEVKWMLGGVEPDFGTISDFRKDNIDSLNKIFNKFNKRLTGAVEWGFTSIDGSKFTACNSKDNNFTKNKLNGNL